MTLLFLTLTLFRVFVINFMSIYVGSGFLYSVSQLKILQPHLPVLAFFLRWTTAVAVNTELFSCAADTILKMSLAVVISFVSRFSPLNPAMSLYHVVPDKSGASFSVAASWRNSKKAWARSAFSGRQHGDQHRKFSGVYVYLSGKCERSTGSRCHTVYG